MKTTPANTCAPLAAAADGVLAQCEAMVLAVPDAAYAVESIVMRGGTFGKHLRHTLDHFAAAAASEAVIDYDRRIRDVPMESDRHAALSAIAGLRERIALLADAPLASPVRVRVMVSAQGHEHELPSTLGRELAFATHHAVHHQAMMKAIAGEFGIDTDDRAGKAPSTLHHARR